MKIHDVEQGSPAWHTLRAGKPTASVFSKLVTGTGKPSESLGPLARILAAEAFADQPEIDSWGGNSHTERGKELESRALFLYEFANDVDVKPVGFVTDDDELYGCSPDGLVGDDGMIEIKCLKAENHIEAILYCRKNNATAPKYRPQTQGQMMICGRAWCDSVFYHPNFPLLVIRNTPDIKMHETLKTGLAKVIAQRDEIVQILKEGTDDE